MFPLLRSNLFTFPFDLEWPRAVENALDVCRAAPVFLQDPDVHVHDKRVPDTPKIPSTPAARPQPRTQALGERKRHFLHVYLTVEHLVRVLDALVLDR